MTLKPISRPPKSGIHTQFSLEIENNSFTLRRFKNVAGNDSSAVHLLVGGQPGDVEKDLVPACLCPLGHHLAVPLSLHLEEGLLALAGKHLGHHL